MLYIYLQLIYLYYQYLKILTNNIIETINWNKLLLKLKALLAV
jgi:hypothetical protein